MSTPQSLFGPLVTAMVTPFTSDGAVDFARAQELAARLLQNGSTGLVVSGTTGESPTINKQEKLDLFRAVKEAAGNAPVIANTGSYDTAASVALTQAAEKIGVAGILGVVPYYSRPSQEGLYQHFKAMAGATSLPVMLYNLPGRTARNMEVGTTARLSEIENIVATKEASGDLAQIARTRIATGGDFQIYSGNDGDTLPMLTLGACGVVSVISHIAGNEMRQMMEAFWNGDTDTARDLHLRLMPVVDALFPATTSNPAPLKAALQSHGFDCGGLRLPLVDATEAERAAVEKAMRGAGLL
jgi:4-hydroxy-tetrahydrodipicolinate synthase